MRNTIHATRAGTYPLPLQQDPHAPCGDLAMRHYHDNGIDMIVDPSLPPNTIVIVDGRTGRVLSVWRDVG